MRTQKVPVADGLVMVGRATLAALGEPALVELEIMTWPWLGKLSVVQEPAEPRPETVGLPAVVVSMPAGIPLEPAVPGVQVLMAESQYKNFTDLTVVAVGGVKVNVSVVEVLGRGSPRVSLTVVMVPALAELKGIIMAAIVVMTAAMRQSCCLNALVLNFNFCFKMYMPFVKA